MIAFDIQNIANVHRAKNLETKNWHHPVYAQAVAPWLQNLAKQYKMAEFVNIEDTLPTLMQQDAIDLLLEMPNKYWFWHLLSVTCERQIERDRLTGNHGVLCKGSVLAAIGAIRSLNPNRLFVATDGNTGQVLAEMKKTSGFLVAAGCLVVDLESTELVQNPLFYADYGDGVQLPPEFSFSHCRRSS